MENKLFMQIYQEVKYIITFFNDKHATFTA